MMRRRSYHEIYRKARSRDFDVRVDFDGRGRVSVGLWMRHPAELVGSAEFEADSEGYMTTGQFRQAAWYAHGLVSAVEAAEDARRVCGPRRRALGTAGVR